MQDRQSDKNNRGPSSTPNVNPVDASLMPQTEASRQSREALTALSHPRKLGTETPHQFCAALAAFAAQPRGQELSEYCRASTSTIDLTGPIRVGSALCHGLADSWRILTDFSMRQAGSEGLARYGVFIKLVWTGNGPSVVKFEQADILGKSYTPERIQRPFFSASLGLLGWSDTLLENGARSIAILGKLESGDIRDIAWAGRRAPGRGHSFLPSLPDAFHLDRPRGGF